MKTYETQKNRYQCLLLFNNNLTSKIIKETRENFVSIRSWQIIKSSKMLPWKRHLHPRCTPFERSGRKWLRSMASLLTAITSHCLTALPAKMPAFNIRMRQTPNIVTWSEYYKICCHVIIIYYYTVKTNSITILSQVRQPASAGKGAYMSELQAQYCMTPEQWTWFLCSVSVTPINKLSLQEINQLVGIELLMWNFLENFGS